MAWMIDADRLLRELTALSHGQVWPGWTYDGIRLLIERQPTLTPPNEPLTLISMSDEIPPDNERVLVYRPCMVDSDTGPYSVQWGWAAKRDGSHWARLPDRRPPEGEEDA